MESPVIASATAVDPAGPPKIAAWQVHLQREIMLVILVAMCVILALREPAFLSSANLLNVLRIASITGVIAFGMTMVIIAGEIDLSVGAVIGLMRVSFRVPTFITTLALLTALRGAAL